MQDRDGGACLQSQLVMTVGQLWVQGHSKLLNETLLQNKKEREETGRRGVEGK